MTTLRDPLPPAPDARQGNAGSGFEPTIGEMLDDPIVQLLMARDGVTRADVEELRVILQIHERRTHMPGYVPPRLGNIGLRGWAAVLKPA